MSNVIIDVIKKIRDARTEEEAREVLLNNIRLIISTEEVALIMKNLKEGPIDDFYESNSEYDENFFLELDKELYRRDLLTKPDYINWMINYSHSKTRFYDEYRGCILKEEDKNQLNKLGLFVDGIIDYFEENDMDYDTYIFGFSYKIKYNNVCFEVGTINGNGPKYYVQKVKEINDDNYIDYNEIIAYTKEKLNKKDKVLTLKDYTKKEE